MKRKFKYIKKILSGILPLCLLFVTASCATQDIDLPDNPGKDQFEGKELICLPFGINFDAGAFDTRATGDLVNGFPYEHQINHDKENECYAIFFDSYKKVKYVVPLHYSQQLTESYQPQETDLGEFTVFFLAYVPKEDVVKDDNTPADNPLSYILVVLNGEPVYNSVNTTVTELLGAQYTDDHVKAFLDLTWDCGQNEINKTIGINKYGNFTMSNSAYLDANNNLMTLTELNKKDGGGIYYYLSVTDFLNNGQTPTAEVYLERMVAKFSEPTSSTDVIGSDKVYRPDQNAMPLVVYRWVNNIPVSEQKNWRIHLLGWTINGQETSNYIFKKIPTAAASSLSGWTDWNDVAHKRSNWSIDPHYSTDLKSSSENEPGKYDFYPWQYRKAADIEATISIETGRVNEMTPALRYYTFEQVGWPITLYANENTFNPNGDWYDETKPTYLDDRASVLAGPHLLITGELFMEDPQGEAYTSGGINFKRVDHLYSDRNRRYYEDEISWFKMFIRDFNRALKAQENMTFPVYDWDGTSDGKSGHKYITYPTGECKLYLTIDGEDKELTYDLVDDLYEENPNMSFSQVANIRNGDGKLIPWIDGIKVKNATGERELGYKLESAGNDVPQEYDWVEDMYKSLFYDWFGPIDHYLNGNMYYAGEIKHQPTVGGIDYFGTVRNHWYTFNIQSINSLGIPVDNPKQLIVPGKYAYRDMVLVHLHILDYHSMDTDVNIP